MVVIVQTGLFQRASLSFSQHAQCAAGFHAQRFDRANQFGDFFYITVFGFTPSRAHAKTACAILFCFKRGGFDLFDIQQFGSFNTRVVVNRLGAVPAVFGATTGFDRQKCRELNFVRIEMFAVNLLSLEHQIAEG